MWKWGAVVVGCWAVLGKGLGVMRTAMEVGCRWWNPLGVGHHCQALEPPSVGLCWFHLAKEGSSCVWGLKYMYVHTLSWQLISCCCCCCCFYCVVFFFLFLRHWCTWQPLNFPSRCKLGLSTPQEMMALELTPGFSILLNGVFCRKRKKQTNISLSVEFLKKYKILHC